MSRAPGKRALLAVALLASALAGVVAFRTATFRSHQVAVEPGRPVEVDPRGAAERLAGALRFRTVSHPDPALFEPGEFLGLHAYLERTYPRVHAALSREIVGDYSLLYAWPGTDPGLKPALLLGHMDVVPVEPGTEGRWTHPPFEGAVEGGFVWGRGALDDKVTVLGLLEGVEALLGEGFRPRRTLYLAFGHDEEATGMRGAARISALLAERGVAPEYVLDEGGFVTEGVVDGVDAPVAIVGTAEKGYMSVEITVRATGGHSSMPPPQSAVGVLAAALARLEANQMPARIEGAARASLEYLGPEMALPRRVALANLWLVGPLVARQMAAKPTTNALVRTTTAVTVFQGGVKDNVMPSSARAVVNFRLLPGDTTAEVLEHVRAAIDDPRVEVATTGPAYEASGVSDPSAPPFLGLARTIRRTFPGTLVAPQVCVATTDSRHYAALTPNVYRFLPARVTRDDLARLHGTDERVSVEDVASGVRFFAELIRETCGG